MRMLLHRGRDGLERRVAIPDSATDAEAAYGAFAGPPEIADFATDRGWPQETARRLHEQLVARGLFDATDVRRAGGHVALRSAIVAALRADVGALWTLYDDR